MNHLGQFNPLNIVNHGGHKSQHPATGYSNTTSKNVEGTHKEFVVFHKNLKNLVMLYKTRHQLMESLNENGLYVSVYNIYAIIILNILFLQMMWFLSKSNV